LRIMPGAIATTPIPRGPRSRASERVIEITAP
jgi:hypothetical protein